MTRLTKRDVETLLDSYDTDPRAALATALGKVLGRTGEGYEALVTAAGLGGESTSALLRGDTAAMDALVAELNEARTLPGH
jgi:hypothetical protein